MGLEGYADHETHRRQVPVAPLTEFHDGLQSLYHVEAEALSWLKTTATTAFGK